jgi:hypothetical protein
VDYAMMLADEGTMVAGDMMAQATIALNGQAR